MSNEPNGKKKKALKPIHYKALELHLAGKRNSEIADELGVSRQTPWRWQKKPSYQAAYNTATEQVQRDIIAHFHRVVDKGLAAAENKLESSDVSENFVLELLRGIGLLSGSLPEVGPTNPQELVLRRKYKKQKIEQSLQFLESSFPVERQYQIARYIIRECVEYLKQSEPSDEQGQQDEPDLDEVDQPDGE